MTWDRSETVVFNDARTEGTLQILTSCVRLILVNRKLVLPVWPEPTSWNTSRQAIAFVGVLGGRLELRDGDRIALGGSSPHPMVEPQLRIGT